MAAISALVFSMQLAKLSKEALGPGGSTEAMGLGAVEPVATGA